MKTWHVVVGGIVVWILWPKKQDDSEPRILREPNAAPPDDQDVTFEGVIWTQGGEVPGKLPDLPPSKWFLYDVSAIQTQADRAALAKGLPIGTQIRVVLSNPTFGVPPSVYRAYVVQPWGDGTYVADWTDGAPTVSRYGRIVAWAGTELITKVEPKNIFLPR
jgi:hypothetical protein